MCRILALRAVAAFAGAVVLAGGRVEGNDLLATIGARDGRLFASGAEIADETTGALVVAEGPFPHMQALAAAKDGEAEATFKLDEPIGARATISFWMRPSTWYRNGEGQATVRHGLIHIPEMADLVFQQAANACLLLWDWDRSVVEGVDGVGNYFAELPGPEWYHVLTTWDCEQGSLNVFVNGTPQRFADATVKPWTVKPQSQFTLRLDGFDIADLRVEKTYLTAQQAQARVPAPYQGRRAELFGLGGEAKPMDVGDRVGALLYESSLASAEAIEGWVMEGPGVLKFDDGSMEMSSHLVDGEPKGHIVHWCPSDFPERFVADWEVRILSEHGLNIVFFAAKGEHGEDIFDPRLPKRNGVFSGYTSGAIVSYHISYYANGPGGPGRIMSNLRKNNKFYLIANGPPGILSGSAEWHRIRLIKDGAHIQLLSNGRVIIDYVDEGKRYGPVHGGGKIGFRQMQWTVGRYRNLRVWELKAQ